MSTSHAFGLDRYRVPLLLYYVYTNIQCISTRHTLFKETIGNTTTYNSTDNRHFTGANSSDHLFNFPFTLNRLHSVSLTHYCGTTLLWYPNAPISDFPDTPMCRQTNTLSIVHCSLLQQNIGEIDSTSYKAGGGICHVLEPI